VTSKLQASKLVGQLLTGEDISSEQYHSLEGSYSSSQLKVALEDIEKFYKTYITKELGRASGTQFDIGTYFHTAILEPEKLEVECAVYRDGIRSGKKWDAFKELHAGKAIITASEEEVANRIIAGVKASPVAMSYLKGSECEVSAFLRLYVFKDEVYYIKEDQVFILVSTGWAPDSSMDLETLEGMATSIVVKVRADIINLKEGVISDLKSSKGNVKSEAEMQQSVSNYNYDMSAALYMDIFSAVSGVTMKKFAWIYASKESGVSKTWSCSDRGEIIGRAKWRYAVLLIAKNIRRKWKQTDEEGVLQPAHWDLHWLQKI